MPRFRKKPVVIEAVQFDGTDRSVNEVLDWMLDRGFMNSAGGHGHDSTGATDAGKMEIETREGVMTVSPGDWVIQGVKREFYPCKPDIFAESYEPES